MMVKTILAAIGFIVVFLGICAGMGWCAALWHEGDDIDE